jgi:diguanylate cyclase (GGDEF)-like protein
MVGAFLDDDCTVRMDALEAERAQQAQTEPRGPTLTCLQGYGGEEFLVVVPGCNLELAARVAERIRAAIGADEVDTAEGRISLTISLGVSAFEPAIGADADTLIRAADRALYRAKDLGRNRVESLAVAGASAGQDRACPA